MSTKATSQFNPWFVATVVSAIAIPGCLDLDRYHREDGSDASVGAQSSLGGAHSTGATSSIGIGGSHVSSSVGSTQVTSNGLTTVGGSTNALETVSNSTGDTGGTGLSTTDSGGTVALGGSPNMGGATSGTNAATGGASLAATTNAVGGSTNIAGAQSSGGKPATGGVVSVGATTSTGGTPVTGSKTGSGGNTTTGGAPSVGSTTSTGGIPSTGGKTGSSGTTTTGVAPIGGTAAAAGGVAGSGGRTGLGGTTATGVTPSVGSTTSMGGTANTAGTTSACLFGTAGNTVIPTAPSCSGATIPNQTGSLSIESNYVTATDAHGAGFTWVGKDSILPNTCITPACNENGCSSSLGTTALCAAGTVPADTTYLSAAGFGFNLNQASDGCGAMGSVPAPLYVAVSYSQLVDSPMRIQLQNGDNRWCYDIKLNTYVSGSLIPIVNFNTKCWDNTGDWLSADMPLQSIDLVISSQSTTPVPFSACLLDVKLVNTRLVATKITTGHSHACAVLSDGSVQCWGANGSGQLGNGTSATKPSFNPVTASGITNPVDVSAGDGYTCALPGDGTIKCWGNNHNGELGNGTTAYSFDPVAVTGITSATAVSAGSGYTCAVLSDKTIKCWGDNSNGELGNGTTTSSPLPVGVVGITNATAVSAGTDHTCALLNDGSVQCWGANHSGQLGNDLGAIETQPITAVSGITSAVAVSSAISQLSCAALSDGSVQCWGENTFGQLGSGITADSSSVPVTIPGVTNAATVSAGYKHVCVATKASSVQCWGKNPSGEFGNGTKVSNTTPATTTGITSAAVVWASESYTCALLSSGGIQCWGSNYNGTLGNGRSTDSSLPVTVVGF